MEIVASWNGQQAQALRNALRLTIEGFAAQLGVAARTIAYWESRPDMVPNPEAQQLLDVALSRASREDQARFSLLVARDSPAGDTAEPHTADQPTESEFESRLRANRNTAEVFEWLDRQVPWSPGTLRKRLMSDFSASGQRRLHDQSRLRGGVSQHQIARALNAYYHVGDREHRPFRVRHGPQAGYTATSILTRPGWLELGVSLDATGDQLALTSSEEVQIDLDEAVANAAVARVGEALILGRRIVNAPLYRLLNVSLDDGKVAGSLGMTTFVRYALTMDMLEGELLDAIAADRSTLPGSLPLRDKYLPTIESVLDLPNRICAGGALALLAIARPRRQSENQVTDYLLLIQERSSAVLNATGRLAVIPKSFHQPLVNYQEDARLRSTLMREMEEELFGRAEVDGTSAGSRFADPMHSNRLTAPMRSLLEESDGQRLRMECTGFGINMVSGNYEFTNLIVIHDETFWGRFGGDLQVNWESSGVRQYSSMNRDLLADLIGDRSWTNEGLFAFIQGLHRLHEIDPDRVDLPSIDWTL